MQAPMWALNSPSLDAKPRAAARRACAGQSPYVAQSRAPPADSRLPNMCRLRKQSARAPPSTTQVQVFARFPPCPVASRMVSLTRPKHSKAADSLAQRRELAQRRLTLRLKRRNFQHGKARRLVHTQRLLLCSGKLDGSPSRNTRPTLYIHTGFRAMTSAMRCDIQWQGARNVVCCP